MRSPLQDLVTLIYTSVATSPPSELWLADLLDGARHNNVKVGVTGMLVCQDSQFLQILEGDRLSVETLFDRIEKDTRHHDVSRIILEPILHRAFPDWSMGFHKASPTFLKFSRGANDFFQSASCLREVDAGIAKDILTSFKQGEYALSA